MRPKNQILVYRTIDAALKAALRITPYCSLTERLALWWGYRFRPDPGLVRLRSGAVICTNEIDHLQLLLRYLGTFEPRALTTMRRHLKPGATLLDIGANIGLFSVEAAHTGANVIAIEAAPHHVEAIKASLLGNSFEHVEVVSCAVWDSDGSATLNLPRGANHGGFTLGNVASDRMIEVPLRRIDDIVAGRRIDLIKIDIEGSEYRALLGARETLQRNRPPILIELNERALKGCGSSTRQVKELLAQYRYKGQLLNGRFIELSTEHYCDECLFLPL